VDGQLAFAENPSDLTGVTVALDAYRLFLADKHDGQSPMLHGYTGEKRLFPGWAQFWRTLVPEEWFRGSGTQSYHSPPRYRVNGIVRKVDAWYEAFDVMPHTRLFLAPEDRVRIW
jgi:putative endopeptidase